MEWGVGIAAEPAALGVGRREGRGHGGRQRLIQVFGQNRLHRAVAGAAGVQGTGAGHLQAGGAVGLLQA